MATGGTGTTGAGAAAAGLAAGTSAGAATRARATPASAAGCATRAETADSAAGDVFSLLAGPGPGSQGICEHAAASVHIAVAASSLLSFSLNGVAFRPQKPRWYPWFPYGSSKWAIQKDFLPEIESATPDYRMTARLVSARFRIRSSIGAARRILRQDRWRVCPDTCLRI